MPSWSPAPTCVGLKGDETELSRTFSEDPSIAEKCDFDPESSPPPLKSVVAGIGVIRWKFFSDSGSNSSSAANEPSSAAGEIVFVTDENGLM